MQGKDNTIGVILKKVADEYADSDVVLVAHVGTMLEWETNCCLVWILTFLCRTLLFWIGYDSNQMNSIG